MGKTKADPFADFRVEDKIEDDAFKKLDKLLKSLVQATKKVAEAEQVLKDAQAKHRQLDEFDIPNYMDSIGLKEFTNRRGIKIEACTTIRASIGKNKVPALAWLIKNKHGAVIKRTVAIAFNVTQGAEAAKLLKEMTKRNIGAGVRQEMKVEAATVTALVRKRLKAGKKVPADIFNVYSQRSTKVTVPQ